MSVDVRPSIPVLHTKHQRRYVVKWMPELFVMIKGAAFKDCFDFPPVHNRASALRVSLLLLIHGTHSEGYDSRKRPTKMI